jgi:hypothetical protein
LPPSKSSGWRAWFNRLDYERERVAAAKKLGIRASVLDQLVEAKKAELFPPGPPPTPSSKEQVLLDDLNADHSVVIIGGRTRVCRPICGFRISATST